MRNILPVSPLLAALAMPLLTPCAPAAPKGEFIVYVGTYTRKVSKGIYAWRFDAATGKLSPIGLVGETTNPSFLNIHPNNRFLYAANEISNFQGQRGMGSVTAFAIDAQSGKLTQLNAASSRGSGPCFVVVDKTGKNLLVVNYGSGSTAVLPVKPDGSLGEATSFVQHSGSSVDKQRQRGPHAHSVNMSPDNRFAFVADLGLDEVLVYRFDPAKGEITPNDPPAAKVAPGSGPRHFNFHPNGKFAYVINEMKSTVTAFSYDAKKGVLSEIQTISTLPKDFSGVNHAAEVLVHPNGRFLYGSNRGHNSLAVFSVNPSKGTLTYLENVSTQGKTPRNFRIDPTGNYLFAANQDTNNIVIFRIDQKTGGLKPTGDVLEAEAPVCIKFVPAK